MFLYRSTTKLLRLRLLQATSSGMIQHIFACALRWDPRSEVSPEWRENQKKCGEFHSCSCTVLLIDEFSIISLQGKTTSSCADRNTWQSKNGQNFWWHTVDGCETLHRRKDGWNPIIGWIPSTGAGFRNHPPVDIYHCSIFINSLYFSKRIPAYSHFIHIYPSYNVVPPRYKLAYNPSNYSFNQQLAPVIAVINQLGYLGGPTL